MPNTKSMLPFNYSNASSPLDDAPYYSRLVEHQIHPVTDPPQQGSASNYVLLGFGPGHALQAAELNEVQENFFMQQSLTVTMMHNWITSGIPTRWGTNDTGQFYPSGIESIGGTDTDGSVEQSIPDEFAVSGPGWKGTTPLFPFQNPDRDTETGTGLVLITGATTLTVTFRQGWYLTELRRDQDSSQSIAKLQTGFKYWAFLEEDTTLSGLPVNTGAYEVGFLVNLKTVLPCEAESCPGWENNEPRDISLNDYSAAFYNQNSAGANRIRISFTEVMSGHIDGNENISSVLKVLPSRQEVRYMNNLLIHKW